MDEKYPTPNNYTLYTLAHVYGYFRLETSFLSSHMSYVTWQQFYILYKNNVSNVSIQKLINGIICGYTCTLCYTSIAIY